MLNISLYYFILLFRLLFPASQEIPAYHEKTEDVWIFDHYEPEEGKIMGIWPRHERLLSAGEIQELRGRFGFNYVLLPASLYRLTFKLLLENGYTADNVMAQIHHGNYKIKMDYYGKIYAYYLDEPNESGQSIEGIREEISVKAKGSLFIISGYRRTNGLTTLVRESDGVMFSSYKHWWQCFPGVWCSWPYNDDQRDDWTDMKERYGSKSFMNWVGAHRDTLEYKELLEHAASLKLKGLWLYQYQDRQNSDENILAFCYNAWINGFLKKIERKYVYSYRCYKNLSADCSKEDWILYRKTATGTTRKADPGQ